MANNKTEVRQILDKVKAEGRTSLTAPGRQARLRRLRHCDAQGRRGDIGRGSREARVPAWAFPSSSRSSRRKYCTRRKPAACCVGVKSAADVGSRLRHDHGQREEIRREGQRCWAFRCSRCSRAGRK